jgi:general L-amino acid transport system permease protein
MENERDLVEHRLQMGFQAAQQKRKKVHGRKTIMVVAVTGFTFTSVLCGLATSLEQMVLFRVLQGVFGAALVPLSQSTLLDINERKDHGKAMAVWGMGVMLGPIVGPSLGGYLTEYYSWRYVFFINLPLGILSLIGLLMWGGVLGMAYVPQERWGGLPITLILSTFGIAFAFPVAIMVALGRRSTKLPAVKLLCVLYVELIRGVPLISLLFMASVMFPLFLPEGITIDKLLRAQVAIILFTAAYLAEVIRGGLQALPRGQYEAADAMGLTYWQKTGFIILPQALRLVIPPLVNTFIGLFKDTSLVLIIGIFDLLTAGKTAIVEPAWQGFGVEVYVAVGVIYFVFCFAMSKYSQSLETEFNKHVRR